jgi:hypothetical protein
MQKTASQWLALYGLGNFLASSSRSSAGLRLQAVLQGLWPYVRLFCAARQQVQARSSEARA